MERLLARERRFGIVPANQLKTPEERIAQYRRLEAMVLSEATALEAQPAANGCTVFVKREFDRPTESHYDVATVSVLTRIEQEILRFAIEKVITNPRISLVEVTSGSAGRSMAYFCSRLGLSLIELVPLDFREKNEDDTYKRDEDIARVRDMKALGTEIVWADEEGGVGLAIRKMYRLLAERYGRRKGWERKEREIEDGKIILYWKGDEVVCVPNHAEIGITPQAFGHIGREIIGQLPKGVQIDTFVATLGNGSTVKGIGEALRAAFPHMAIIGTEPLQAPVTAIRKICAQLEIPFDLKTYTQFPHVREAFLERYGFPCPSPDEMEYHNVPGNSDPRYVARFVEVGNIDDIILYDAKTANRPDWYSTLRRRQNLYAWLANHGTNAFGNSSAVNLWHAYRLAEDPRNANKNILVFSYDKADQYSDWPPNVTRTPYIAEAQPPFETMYEYVQRVYGQRTVA